MLTVSATELTHEAVAAHGLVCNLIDHSAITYAEMHSKDIEGCRFVPVYAISMQPAPDMIIPMFLCFIHFNAFKLSLHEGVGVDEDVFGKFPKH